MNLFHVHHYTVVFYFCMFTKVGKTWLAIFTAWCQFHLKIVKMNKTWDHRIELHLDTYLQNNGVTRSVMVIVVGNEHSNMSSNPGRDWLHFT